MRLLMTVLPQCWDSDNNFRGAIFSFSPVIASEQKAIHSIVCLPSFLVHFLHISEVIQYFLCYDLQKCILLKKYELGASVYMSSEEVKVETEWDGMKETLRNCSVDGLHSKKNWSQRSAECIQHKAQWCNGSLSSTIMTTCKEIILTCICVIEISMFGIQNVLYYSVMLYFYHLHLN